MGAMHRLVMRVSSNTRSDTRRNVDNGSYAQFYLSRPSPSTPRLSFNIDVISLRMLSFNINMILPPPLIALSRF